MSQTFEIRDGVRRAKAADIAGRETIWAQIGESKQEQKVPIRSLLSPKSQLDVSRQRERWINIKRQMAEEPDLLPPIHIEPGSAGTPIHDVPVVGEAGPGSVG